MAHSPAEEVTFSFGRNWRNFLEHADERNVELALADVREWLGDQDLAGRSVLDIGCGSGIHSLCFHGLAARRVVSFDRDPESVAATRELWARAGSPQHWQVLQGSVLEPDFVASLDTHDLVYSWGVLHHTGSMWEALRNAASRVAPGGLLWIALYAKGPAYASHLATKQAYNRASPLGKKWMVWRRIARRMWKRLRRGRNPFTWNETGERGMDVYHDIVDWLGGLPYEVASVDEVGEALRAQGFEPLRVLESREGGNHVFLFRAAPAQARDSAAPS